MAEIRDGLTTDMTYAVVALCAIFAVVLWLLSGHLRRKSGLPVGRVIYTDTGAWQRNEQPLYSSRYRLAGKPDYLVRQGQEIIPVEVKSGRAPGQPYAGHILQLAAYCLLVEDVRSRPPRYGIIQYADRQFAVDYTAELKATLIAALADMQHQTQSRHGPPPSHASTLKCARCGVRDACEG